MGFLIIFVVGTLVGWMIIEFIIALIEAGRFAFSSILAFITMVVGTWLVHNYVPFWFTGTIVLIVLFLSALKRHGSFM